MKKQILYISAGVLLTLITTVLWAFKSSPEEPAKYAVADFYYSKSLLDKDCMVNISYNDGTPDEPLKFNNTVMLSKVLVQLQGKMEEKGYALERSNVASVNSNVLYNQLFFKKK